MCEFIWGADTKCSWTSFKRRQRQLTCVNKPTDGKLKLTDGGQHSFQSGWHQLDVFFFLFPSSFSQECQDWKCSGILAAIQIRRHTWGLGAKRKNVSCNRFQLPAAPGMCDFYTLLKNLRSQDYFFPNVEEKNLKLRTRGKQPTSGQEINTAI